VLKATNKEKHKGFELFYSTHYYYYNISLSLCVYIYIRIKTMECNFSLSKIWTSTFQLLTVISSVPLVWAHCI
jgi:hypothetical protein